MELPAGRHAAEVRLRTLVLDVPGTSFVVPYCHQTDCLEDQSGLGAN